MQTASIVIPVYNLAAITRQCLDRLLAQTHACVSAEIIVVDDASSDETDDMLKAYGDQIRVVRHEKNSGFARSCNDGASLSSSRFLVFLNNDTMPMPGWLDALVNYAEVHEEAAAVGAKLLYPDGTIQHAGMAIDGHLEPRHLYVGFPGDHPAVNRSRKFPMVTGACMLLPRASFEAAKGFDTAFRNGYEDVDLCLRLGRFGREIHYCHESEVIHLESVSEGRTDRDAANHALYSKRWKKTLTPSDWLYYLEDGLIRLEYGASTPLRIQVAPELATIDDESRNSPSDRLLAARARQVYDLLKENIELRVRSTRGSRSA